MSYTLRCRPKLGLPIAGAPMCSTICSSTTASLMRVGPPVDSWSSVYLCLYLSAQYWPTSHFVSISPSLQSPLPACTVICFHACEPSLISASLLFSIFLKVLGILEPVRCSKEVSQTTVWAPNDHDSSEKIFHLPGVCLPFLWDTATTFGIGSRRLFWRGHNYITTPYSHTHLVLTSLTSSQYELKLIISHFQNPCR